MSNDITALELIVKIKKQTESFDTVVLQEGEANVLVEALEKAQRQIQAYERANAELGNYAGQLESRTVTVKLYDDFQLCHYGTTEDYAKGYIDSQNNFTKWLSAAGIKVKGE
ncbi:TPA: hypothetical protein G9E89_002365 [Salmonella enterica]|uniref:Ead/Ea22-like family protein n=1 Tax=Salmonella enterica TaxID=28901 RepID=A0A749PSG1_SALER|nr:hypothetical protein [Salmonella enterica]